MHADGCFPLPVKIVKLNRLIVYNRAMSFDGYLLSLLALSNTHLMFLFGRSINYDERDPFLCNACGFCKYAKFDYTLTARPCCAVDPIENEEDRKKVLTFAKKKTFKG